MRPHVSRVRPVEFDPAVWTVLIREEDRHSRRYFETWREAYDWGLAYARRNRVCRCGFGSIRNCLTTKWGCFNEGAT